MITIVTVWLFLITCVKCDVIITINSNGSDNDTCCIEGNCSCSSLSSALPNMSDNTLINITSESVTLHDVVGMGSGNMSNITITGNGATIMCNNTGGVYCESCSNITIMGITWYQCGGKNSKHPIMQTSALSFTNVSSEILIQDCTFRNSSGCPVYIQNSAKGNISIIDTYFMEIPIDDADDFLCAGLNISANAPIVLAVNNSRFDGCGWNLLYGCISAIIDLTNYVFGYNQLLFENTNFSNSYYGLLVNTSFENVLIELFHINVCSSYYGIIALPSLGGDTNNSAGTVIISSATFIDNIYALTIVTNNISISSATFLDNHYALVFAGDEKIVVLSIDIDSSNFISTASGSMVIIILLSANLTFVTVSNSSFNNNIFMIRTLNPAKCKTASVIITNVTFFNATLFPSSAYSVVDIDTEDTIIAIMLNKVRFMSNYAFASFMGPLLVIQSNLRICSPTQPVSIQLTDCTFHNNTASDQVAALNVINDKSQDFIEIDIELSNCNFDYNVAGKSIVTLGTPTTYIGGIISVILENLKFSNNTGTALYLTVYHFQFKGNILFINNSASSGAAVYLEEVYAISTLDNTNVQFINNYAEQKGGAMYIHLDNPDTWDHTYCTVFQSISNTSNVSFINNIAGIAGNSIYFDIPKSCKIITDINNDSSLLYFPCKFIYNQSEYAIHSPIVTSPYNVTLYPPAIAMHNSSNDYSIPESKMLGEPIQFTASVFDYFGNITEPVAFSITCRTCNDYALSTYQITIHDHSILELKIFPITRSNHDVEINTNISLIFLSALLPIYKNINVSLSIELSPCRAGYLFNYTQRQCVCFPYPHIVHCTGGYVEIKIGYWIGFLIEQHCTSSVCPRNYCNSKLIETTPGFYSLHGKPDDQCSSHRTGVACGECKPGYTLAYDSPDCINTDKCTAGMTILVIVLTILYWIAIVAIVFGLKYFQFQISSGYAYGIIYYYSVVDVLLVNDVSEEVFQLVGILSSFAKLTPQLFGKLCLVDGLSGIDQQFIHYSHALAVSLILLIITVVTRYSPRLAAFVSRCIIRVICILLLLSYTSLASTSLQLLRPLIFNDADEVRTYSSPDIKYFTGRHLAYAIVALLCEVIIVIGLPVFLLLEPFLRQRVNFIKIKPLLDQFQGCYKDKYRWFAAYYLICRQVIILIVYVLNINYYYMLYGLQTVCVIIAMIHIWLQPYKSTLLNGLDAMILLILVLVVNLNLFASVSFVPTNYFSVALVILPLFFICFIVVRLLLTHYCSRRSRLLRLYNPVETYDENYNGNNDGR